MSEFNYFQYYKLLIANINIIYTGKRLNKVKNFYPLIFILFLNIILTLKYFLSRFYQFKFDANNKRVLFAGISRYSYSKNAKLFFSNSKKPVLVLDSNLMFNLSYFNYSDLIHIRKIVISYLVLCKSRNISFVKLLVRTPLILNNLLAFFFLINHSKSRKTFYFSLPSSIDLLPVLSFCNYLNFGSVHIFHGRSNNSSYNSICDLAIVKTDKDKDFVKSGFLKSYRHVLKVSSPISKLKVSESGIIIFFHGYLKGVSKYYNFQMLLKDLSLINSLLLENSGKCIYILPHPTAFLLTKSRFLFSIWGKKIVFIESLSNDLIFSKIYSSSPTFSIELTELKVPFVDLSEN